MANLIGGFSFFLSKPFFVIRFISTYYHLLSLAFIGTFMCVVKGSEGDNKERSRVFPSIDQVRESPLGVPITSQALDESKPGRKTLDHCTDPVGVGITNVSTCRETDAQICSGICRPSRMILIPLSLFCTAYPPIQMY